MTSPYTKSLRVLEEEYALVLIQPRVTSPYTKSLRVIALWEPAGQQRLVMRGIRSRCGDGETAGLYLMTQHTFFDVPVANRFDGATFDPAKDGARLTGQLLRVKELMSDGMWRTLAAISRVADGSEAAVSARLRDLRKPRFGGHTVERRRVDGGLYQYRLIVKESQ